MSRLPALSGLFPVIVCATAVLPAAVVEAAEPADRSPWSAKSSDERCTLGGAAVDADGKAAASVEISWSLGGGYLLTVSLTQLAPVAPWVLESSGKGEVRGIFAEGSRSRFTSGSIEKGEQLVRELSAGRALVLTVGTGASASRYTTGNGDVAASAHAFDECIAQMRAKPRLPSSWAAETSGRGCSLRSRLAEVPGAEIAFGVGANRALRVSVYADTFMIPDGGVLQVDLPGGKPWIIDTRLHPTAADPREKQLLDALLQLQPVPMTFTPQGAASVKLQPPLGNLEVAGPMFRDCMTAVQSVSLPPQRDFAELSYTVSEAGNSCELSGTFQIQGNALWLVLSSDGNKNSLKVTRRMVKSGYRIESLDMSGFGGPKRLTAEDAVLELDTSALANLRSDLVGAGRDFGMRMNRTESYTAQFGGRFAPLEATMYNACVEAKSSPRP